MAQHGPYLIASHTVKPCNRFSVQLWPNQRKAWKAPLQITPTESILSSSKEENSDLFFIYLFLLASPLCCNLTLLMRHWEGSQLSCWPLHGLCIHAVECSWSINALPDSSLWVILDTFPLAWVYWKSQPLAIINSFGFLRNWTWVAICLQLQNCNAY